ncbi:MAG: M14 family metallocarboxypeptidase, partial [Oscillospiraceae bacterium]|nr:M14 family metallocarboxypeptidase [Oscillospiraceae bacterium]
EALPVGARLVVPLGFPVVPTDIDWCAALTACCVQGLAAHYPFIETGQIGSSELGRPLWRLQLGRGENRVLYNAAHHANEWITTPLLLHFAEELAAAFAGGGSLFEVSAAEILDYAAIALIPSVNPDGTDLVTGELQSGDAYRAALRIAADYPRFPFPGEWKANLRGVDLNLQYPAGWEQARENKYAQGISSPAPADFVGEAPLAAAESRALYAYTFAFDPALTLSWHTQGEVIYWRYLDREPEGAAQIAEAFSRASGYAVEDAPYASGFAGYKDWFILAFDRPGFTIEAGRGQNPLPIADFPALYERTRGILTLGALLT